MIEKQYYNEIYKMGSISRKDSYPISLQSVWTADNGQLPPWKGDYHHDLNTQLSYLAFLYWQLSGRKLRIFTYFVESTEGK